MRVRVLVVMAALVAGCGAAAWGNDGAVTGVGGAVKLMQGHPSVVMRSARVKIHLASARVECEYVFENTGGATEVLMGFPESGGGDVSVPKGAETGFGEFRSWVDGKKVRVTPHPAKEAGGGYERFWVKQVSFSAGQRRVVRNTYVGGGGSAIFGHSFFEYELSPAASWNGNVGTLEVEVDLSGMGTFSMVSVAPAGHTRSGNTIRWRWGDIEPAPDMNLHIAYFSGYDDIWIDGRKCEIAVPSRAAANPYPYIREGALMVTCRDIAAFLGLTLSEDEEGERATLAGKDKRLVITRGESTAQFDSKRVELGTEAAEQIGTGSLWVPLRPVAEAFRARVRFDPLTKRTYVHTARALAEARAPEWLDRRLIGEELRGKSVEELRRMRNAVYARRGREFQDRELRHHFHCQPWYEPNPRYTDALLNEVDWANIALIRRAEKGRTGTGGDRDQATVVLDH